MTNMVEKVAEAIRPQLFEADGVAEHMHEAAALRAARAAILAMREPTEEMIRSGAYRTSPDNGSMYAAIYRAMIDAALSPPQSEQGG